MKIIRFFVLIFILAAAVCLTYLIATEQIVFMWEAESGGACNPQIYAGIKAFGKVVYAKELACSNI